MIYSDDMTMRYAQNPAQMGGQMGSQMGPMGGQMGDQMAPQMMGAQMGFPRILHTVQHCEATCEDMTHMVLNRPDVARRARQLSLLGDCAEICTMQAKFIARKSPFAKEMARLCAHICEVCGNECLKFQDAASQRCGQICLNCARECRAFAG